MRAGAESGIEILEEVLEMYLRTHGGRSKLTRRFKTYDLNLFLEFLQTNYNRKTPTIFDITEVTIADYIEHRLESGDAPSTANRRINHLKHFCRKLSDYYGVPNPAQEFKELRVGSHGYQGLQEKQVEALRNAIENAPIRDRFLVELFLNTGLRREEVVRLRMEQLDGNWLEKIWRKQTKFQNIFINQRLFPILLCYLKERERELIKHDSHYIRLGPKKQEKYPLIISTRSAVQGAPQSYRYSSEAVYRTIKKYCQQAELPHNLRHPHTLRHTFARNLLKASNNDLPLVQKALGHASIKATMVYLENDEEEVAREMNKL